MGREPMKDPQRKPEHAAREARIAREIAVLRALEAPIDKTLAELEAARTLDDFCHAAWKLLDIADAGGKPDPRAMLIARVMLGGVPDSSAIRELCRMAAYSWCGPSLSDTLGMLWTDYRERELRGEPVCRDHVWAGRPRGAE